MPFERPWRLAGVFSKTFLMITPPFFFGINSSPIFYTALKVLQRLLFFEATAFTFIFFIIRVKIVSKRTQSKTNNWVQGVAMQCDDDGLKIAMQLAG